MRRTLAITALALTALTLSSCLSTSERQAATPAPYVQVVPQSLPASPDGSPPPPTVPASPMPPVYLSPASADTLLSPRRGPAPDPLDVRRSVLEKKSKLLKMEAEKLALEKSMRDLRAEIAAEEKKLEKLPKKKAATKAKLPSVGQQVSVHKAEKADADAALAMKLEAILQRLDRLERRPSPVPAPGVPAQ